MRRPALSVVVPTRDRIPRLRIALTCLSAALAAESVRAEVLVVDDGSADARGVCDVVERACPDATVLRGEPAGRAAARNRGAAVARADRLLFLDGDMIVAPGALRAHAGAGPRESVSRGAIRRLPWLALFDDPERGVLTASAQARSAGTAHFSESTARHRLTLLEGRPTSELLVRAVRNSFERDIERLFAATDETQPTRWVGVIGAHVSLARSTFERLGGFDDSFRFVWGAEDLEFGFRAARAGVVIEQLAGALALHMDHEVEAGRSDAQLRAFEMFAARHGRPEVLRLWDYFRGGCSLEEATSWSTNA